MKIRWFVISLIAMIAVSQSATAGQWFAGVDVGYVEDEFQPKYAFVSGREPVTYKNESNGTQLGLYVGCAEQIVSRLSLAYQLRIAVSDSEWALSIPSEPATFCYKMPLTLGLTLLPTVQVTENSWVFAELGLANTRIHEQKTSTTRSSYDFEEWRSGTVCGFGVGYNLTDALTMSLHYRATAYESFSYRTFLPDGDWEETVTDDPKRASYSAACTYRF